MLHEVKTKIRVSFPYYALSNYTTSICINLTKENKYAIHHTHIHTHTHFQAPAPVKHETGLNGWRRFCSLYAQIHNMLTSERQCLLFAVISLSVSIPNHLTFSPMLGVLFFVRPDL